MMPDTAPTGLCYERGELRDAAGRSAPWPTYGVLGDPVAHSLSPRLHAAALAHHRIDASYAAIQVDAADLAACLDAAARGGVRGLNVTVPHKSAVMSRCERVSEEARVIGAVNTLVRRDDAWQGHNTDARGLALALQHELGRSLSSWLDVVLVVGAGGAARAAVHAMIALGARTTLVAARDTTRAAWARATAARVVELSRAPLERASLLVQATPLGLDPDDPSPVHAERLAPSCFVFDLTYGPSPSRLLRESRARGCRTQDGLPLLIAQAALAFSLWHGALAPLPTMARAVGRDWV